MGAADRLGHAWWYGLAAVSATVLLVQLPGPHATAWHFFDDAVERLLDDGLQLYVERPEFQFGPLSVLVALPFTWFGGAAEAVVMIAGSIAGLVAVRVFLDTDEELRPMAASIAAGVIVITWGDVAVRTAHIDDAVTLLALVVAVRAVGRDRAVAATVALVVAAAVKPWGVVFAPLAAVPEGPRRWLRPVIAATAAVATWAPFILAAPDTLDTTDFGIDNDPTSVLRALGVDAATTPGWVRPAQLVGGIALVAAVVAVRHWHAALLTGVAWRLLLDPGAHRYYTIGFVLGALLVELRARPGRVPWFTVAAALALEVTAVPDIHVGAAQSVRAATVIAALVVVGWQVARDAELRATPVAPRAT